MGIVVFGTFLKFIFILLVFLVSLLLFSQEAIAQSWFYPLAQTQQRESFQKFGQSIDKSFYKGRENLFPNQFYRYHAGIDLEIFPNELEKSVPVYTIYDGVVVFAEQVSGYGGLILERIPNENITILYGHLKLKNLKFKVGDKVKAGEIIASSLGDAFSNETSGERKHLHLGIYKGHHLYFKGYEQTRQNLNKKWLNPLQYLEQNGAIDLGQPNEVKPSPLPAQDSLDIMTSIFNFIKEIFGKLI